MKKVIFAASILLVASLAMTGCGAAREQVPAPSAQAAAAYVETIPATEAARTQAASEAMTTAEAKPAETTAPVTAATEAAVVTTAATTAKPAATTAATTAKPAATTAATTAKPATTTAASTSKSAAATEATLPNPPCPGFEKELAPAPAPATEMAPAPAPEMAPAPAPAPTQNAIMNYIGSYSNGRAVMTVSANGNDRANIRISWSGSAFETAVWKMSGTVRAIGDCVIVDYTDCFKETFTYTTDGAPLVDAIEYTNGSGSVTFHFSDAIWDDFQENAAEGTVFSYYAD